MNTNSGGEKKPGATEQGAAPVETKKGDGSESLQEPFLNALRRQKVPVSIYLVNGIKLQGVVESFDSYVVLLKGSNVTQMVYKHAISTIVPGRSVNLNQ